MTNLIRLNEKGIRAYTSRAGSTHGPSVCWAGRLGRLVKYNRDRSLAYVIWEGTRTPDRVSVGLIEPCSGVADDRDLEEDHLERAELEPLTHSLQFKSWAADPSSCKHTRGPDRSRLR
jgi:hypothetical protein